VSILFWKRLFATQAHALEVRDALFCVPDKLKRKDRRHRVSGIGAANIRHLFVLFLLALSQKIDAVCVRFLLAY